MGGQLGKLPLDGCTCPIRRVSSELIRPHESKLAEPTTPGQDVHLPVEACICRIYMELALQYIHATPIPNSEAPGWHGVTTHGWVDAGGDHSNICLSSDRTGEGEDCVCRLLHPRACRQLRSMYIRPLCRDREHAVNWLFAGRHPSSRSYLRGSAFLLYGKFLR